MAAATTNYTTVATGTSDYVFVRKDQLVNVTSTNWNGASAAVYFMAQANTNRAHTVKQSIGSTTTLAFTANDSFSLAGNGYVYLVVTGTATDPIQLLVE